MATNNPKSMHSRKGKFLYIHRGVIEAELSWMALSFTERLAKRPYPFKGKEQKPQWYGDLVVRASPLDNIPYCSNRMLVYFGCSRACLREGQEVVKEDEGNIMFY